MTIEHAKVVVVGAGLAGLAAARRLSELGVRPMLLEAGQRVGGRTLSDQFGAAGTTVDLGAEWLAPSRHDAVVAEARRYGIGFAAGNSGIPTWSITGRRVTAEEPLVGDELDEYHAVLASMDADATAIDFDRNDWHRQGLSWDVPFDDYLATKTSKPIVRERVLIESFGLMGADSGEYSALNLLHEFAGFGGSHEAFTGKNVRISGGTAVIAEAIARDLGEALTFGRRVSGVTTGRDGVVVHTDGGDVAAAAVILAIPVNVLSELRLDIGLNDLAKKVLAEGHAGRVAKVWSAVTGLGNGYRSLGWPDLVDAYGLDGTQPTVVAGFDLTVGAGADMAEVVAEHLRQRHPGSGVSETCWHDWVNDPNARGTWHSARPGQAPGWYELANFHGPCVFAGGDVSRRWVGWMDGALTSGLDAADRIAQWLAGKPVPPVSG